MILLDVSRWSLDGTCKFMIVFHVCCYMQKFSNKPFHVKKNDIPKILLQLIHCQDQNNIMAIISFVRWVYVFRHLQGLVSNTV